MGRRFREATARTRLDRGTDNSNRISLGGGTQRDAAELVAEFVRLKVDIIVTYWNPVNPRGQAGDLGHPDRLCGGGRPGSHRHSRESGATWRQRHGLVTPGD